MTEMWAKLAEPFPDQDIKQRPGRGGMTFSYVDARTVAQRLDDVVTPSGWDFTCSVIPGTDIVKGTLTVGGVVREDHGYPNSDADEEPIKAATSDALKRCAVLFGIGRHLYSDNKPAQRPQPVRNAPQRPVAVERDPASNRPMPTSMPEFPDDFGAGVEFAGERDGRIPPEFPTIGLGRAPQPGDQCPEHPGKTWAGSVGDLFHKKDEGGYCRPVGQKPKAKVAR